MTPTLLAQSDVRDDAEVIFTDRTVPTSALVEGQNVLAVEVHQASRTSSDMGFDVELVGQRSALPTIPRLAVRRADNQLVLTWPGNLTEWRLESSPRLGTDAAWAPVPGTASASGSETTHFIPPSEGPAFYRLARP